MEGTRLHLSPGNRRVQRQSLRQPEKTVDGEPGAMPEAVVPVQLISQTSNLELSTSGDDAQSSGANSLSFPNLPGSDDVLTTLMSTQPCLEEHPAAIWPSQGTCPCTDQSEQQLHDSPEAILAILDNCAGPNSGSRHRPATSPTGGSPMALGLVEQDTGATTVLMMPHHRNIRRLYDLPTEVLLQILGYLDVCDLLTTSRTSRLLRHLSLAPILHQLRLRRTRAILPPMLTSPSRPSLADLIRRSIFLTKTTVVSRTLARSLVSIRLSRQLAARPSAEVLVERCVLPPECIPGKGVDGCGMVAPALVARKRAVERERVKDGLRKWVGSVWRGEVQHREERVRKWEERVGVGRVWRLTRFWERMGAAGESGH